MVATVHGAIVLRRILDEDSTCGFILADFGSCWIFDRSVADSFLGSGLLVILGVAFDHSVSYESSGGGADHCPCMNTGSAHSGFKICE